MIHEIITDGLNQCPFCGEAAEMKVFAHAIMKEEKAVNIRCTVCGCGTPEYSTGHTFQFAEGEPSRYIDLTEVKSKAMKAYNRVPKKSHDEKMLLQDYRKLDELNRGCVLERIAILLEKQRREQHERRHEMKELIPPLRGAAYEAHMEKFLKDTENELYEYYKGECDKENDRLVEEYRQELENGGRG